MSGAFRRCGPDFVCLRAHDRCEDHCHIDEDCENYPLSLCDQAKRKCRHKNLFEGTVGPDVAAAVVFFVISGLALSAGIGGGGLYVPLLMIITGFSVRTATATSQACLSGGASTALIYNLRQRHPSGRKPMIDYDLVLVMGPNLLIGALIGSALNASAPPWLILVLLTLILCQSAYKTFTKAVQTWRKEGQDGGPASGGARLARNPIERLLRLCARKRYTEFDEGKAPPTNVPPQLVGADGLEDAAIDVEVNAAAERPAADRQDQLASTPADTQSCATPSDGDKASLDARQQVQLPRRRLAIFALMWAIVVASIFIRGGRTFEGLVPFCSAGYWLVPLATAAALEGIGVFAAFRAIAHGSPPGEDGGLHWTPQAARKIMLWSLVAGTVAALCGIGGGMVMGPILLNLGFLPQVQSATTATTLFVMSTSTCIAFLVAGTAPLDYSLWLALFTGLGAVLGKAVIGWVIKRFRRPSLIMFLLGFIISASVLVMSITGTVDVVNDIRNGKGMLFKSFCHTDDED